MESIATKYGTFTDVSFIDHYESGACSSFYMNSKESISTSGGVLEPQYFTEDMGRRRATPICFHDTGNIKSLPLQSYKSVETPMGDIKAEYITFYSTGELRKVFPLNGRLSGYWTDKDEFKLAELLNFDTSAGSFKTKPINVNFYKSGALRSVTLWPGETVDVLSTFGITKAKVGVAFYESGELRSFEPNAPYTVNTPIGVLTGFDTDPEGISGDVNSIQFHKSGELKALLTVNDIVKVKTSDGNIHTFTPRTKRSYCSDLVKVTVPLLIEFENGLVRFDNHRRHEFTIENCSFEVEVFSKHTSKAAIYEC